MGRGDLAWVVVFIAAAGAAAYVATQLPSIISPQPTQLVTVSGHVVTTGLGTSPTQIKFSDQGNHQVYTVPIVNGNYTTSLYSGETYNVSVFFHGLLGTGTSKNCQSVIEIPSGSGAYAYNVTC